MPRPDMLADAARFLIAHRWKRKRPAELDKDIRAILIAGIGIALNRGPKPPRPLFSPPPPPPILSATYVLAMMLSSGSTRGRKIPAKGTRRRR